MPRKYATHDFTTSTNICLHQILTLPEIETHQTRQRFSNILIFMIPSKMFCCSPSFFKVQHLEMLFSISWLLHPGHSPLTLMRHFHQENCSSFLIILCKPKNMVVRENSSRSAVSKILRPTTMPRSKSSKSPL